MIRVVTLVCGEYSIIRLFDYSAGIVGYGLWIVDAQ